MCFLASGRRDRSGNIKNVASKQNIIDRGDVGSTCSEETDGLKKLRDGTCWGGKNGKTI
jgi:hypothetical protein